MLSLLLALEMATAMAVGSINVYPYLSILPKSYGKSSSELSIRAHNIPFTFNDLQLPPHE